MQGHYNRMATLALVIWEYLITVEDERVLFWKRHPWTFATFLFLWCRYIGILLALWGLFVAVTPGLTDSLCTSWLRAEGWIGMSVIWSTQAILQLRIYALYEGSPKIAALISTLFLMEVVSIISMFAFASVEGQVVAEAMHDMVRCKVTAVPSWIWLFWITMTSFELLLCILALYKGCQRVYLRRQFPDHRVLQDILIRDSVIFYVAIQGIYLFNLACWIRDTKDSLDVLTGLAVALPSVMGGRLMINVRRAMPDTELPLSPSDISGELSLSHFGCPDQ